MKITDRRKGDVHILKISGEIKYENAAKLGERIKQLLADGAVHFVIDMKSVGWLDSMGIGETVACCHRVRSRGGQFKLVLKSRAHDLFTLSQLDRVMQIYRDVEDALASFAHEPSDPAPVS